MPIGSQAEKPPQLWGEESAAPHIVPPPPADGGRAESSAPTDDDLVLLLSVKQAGKALGVGRSTVYELIHSGDLEVVHVRHSARIPVDAIRDYVRRLRRA